MEVKIIEVSLPNLRTAEENRIIADRVKKEREEIRAKDFINTHLPKLMKEINAHAERGEHKYCYGFSAMWQGNEVLADIKKYIRPVLESMGYKFEFNYDNNKGTICW